MTNNRELILQAASLLTQALKAIDSTTGWTDEQLKDEELCKAHTTAGEAIEKAQGRVNNLLYHTRRVGSK